MKKTVFLVLVLLTLPGVLANVLITEVLYNPETSESDTEFVEIFNQGEQDIDISGWILNTTTIQATIPSGTTIKANGYFLIADNDDNNNWPSLWAKPDYSEEEISLTNTNSGIQLLDSDGNLVDVVGWGSPINGLYEGTPHQEVSEGESLSRIKQNSSFVDTNNNANDFSATTPNPSNSNQSNGQVNENGIEISLYATVSGNPPKIDFFNISPDESQEEGIQVLPFPGANKKVLFNVVLTDFDGYDDINNVVVQLQVGTVNLDFDKQLNETSALYTSYFNMSFYYSPGNYSVSVFVDDYSGLNSTSNTSFEYLGIVAFDIDTNNIFFGGSSGSFSEVWGDLDMSTLSNPTIKNIGNLPLDFQISGTDLSSEFDTMGVNNIQYTFLDNDYNNTLSGVLLVEPRIKELNLVPGENQLREFTTRLFIPSGTSVGEYSGRLLLTGLAS